MRGVIRALARRLALPPRREAAPLALLLLALSSVFVFGGDRGYLYRPGHHDFDTSQTMTVAANLSPGDGFQMCRRRRPESGPGPSCAHPYNVFPIGPFALVRLATEAVGDSFVRQLYAARLLMLAFFAAAAVLAYLSLVRLLGDRWIAAAATLLAWSSYYLLHYSDMVSSQVPALFGVMLAFHGMVLFAQEGRFRQLLARTAVALLLGWHAVALVAAFVPLALGRELMAARADGGGGRPKVVRRLRPRAILSYGAFSALCLGLLLGWAVANEFAASGSEAPLTGLRVFDSLARRSGFASQQQDFDEVGWPGFLLQQLGGAGGSAIPFAFVDRLDLDLAVPDHGYWPPNPWFAALGAAVLAACAAGLRVLSHRTLWAALLLTGWGWAIALRGSAAAHEQEAMFHAGAALTLFALALLGLRRILGPKRAGRALPAAALAAAALFALSARDMSGIAAAGADIRLQREVAADIGAIRGLAAGRGILVSPANRAMGWIDRDRNFYLVGSYTRADRIGSREEWARASASGAFDFVLAPVGSGGSLTPGNRRLHLYRPSALDAAWDAAAAREPALRAAFGIRLDGRTLTWTREPCAEDDMWPHLFVEAAPLDAGPAKRFEFSPGERGLRFGGRCLVRFELPDYPIAGLRTGQLAGGDLPPVWQASLPVGDPSFPRRASSWYEDVTAAGPAARGPFGVYLEGRALTYVRDGCAREDAEPRFFVHAWAADAGDLPADRREAGFEALGFAFGDHGVRFGDTCMARIALPDYALRSVRTGQYDDGGHLWDAEFAPGAEAWLARFDALAAREPDARGAGFALRLEGRTLTLAREGCSAADVADRFFVHAYAADGAREAIDFWFRQRGERHGDRCLASVALPPSAVRVAAGQYDASGHLWEAALPIGAASE